MNSEYQKLKKSAGKIYLDALKKGILVRPDHCSICQRKKGEKNGAYPDISIHGHHNDYSNPLDVIWLCQSCHSKIPRMINYSDKKVGDCTLHVNDRNFYTVSEVAEKLSVSYGKMHGLVINGDIVSYKCGMQWRIKKVELSRYYSNIKSIIGKPKKRIQKGSDK